MTFVDDICKEIKGLKSLEKEDLNLGYVDSGSYALNRVISGKYKDGGYPIGAITEIYGESSTAKTVFVTHALAEAQKAGYHTIFIDNERALSKEFASVLGIDPKKLLYSPSETMEDCFKILEEVTLKIREKDPDTPIIAVLDSIGSTPTKAEIEKDFGEDATISGAIRAKVAGQCLRKINQLLRNKKVAFLIVNQVRNKIGVMFGDPTTTAGGGKALPFYAAVRLKTVSGPKDLVLDDMKNAVGIHGRVVNKKNKCTIPFLECDFQLLYNKGLTKEYGVLKLLEKEKKVVRSGAWYSIIGSDQKFQSKNFSEILESNPQLLD